MVLEKRTAFLVIHGVGPHMPFEACDSFVRGFHEVFKKNNPGITPHHKVVKREDWLGKGIEWVQNYVSLSMPGNKGSIDFYEYFWDIYMVHDVSLGDAFKMLIGASKSAREFYESVRKEHPDLLVKATDLGEYGRKRRFGTGPVEFRPAGYLKLLGPSFGVLTGVLTWLPFLLNMLEKWAGTQLPILSQIFKACGAFIEEKAKDFVGDLVRYLDLNPRSARFETRQQIIKGALEELRELIKDDRYDQVIIAGHSLGSVIAYDTLNRVIQDANVGVIAREEASKITGLVTFGSPLDKIALFFRDRVKEDKEVQRQILANLHAFRTRSLVANKTGIDLGNPLEFKLPETRWLNFYNTRDLISGKLDLYDLANQRRHSSGSKDGNILIDVDVPRSAAHSCYWGENQGKGKGTNKMYEIIIEEFFP